MDNEEIAREHQLIFDLAKSNKRRIDNLEEEQKELRSLTQAVGQMVVEQKNMRDDLAEMKNDLKQIKETYPANRVEVDVNQNIQKYINQQELEIENEVDNCYVIKISNEEKAHNLLNELIKDKIKINKFEIKKPTLNDLFIEKVGE